MAQSNIEYEVITKTRADLQKVLNQWRHSYKLTIEGVTLADNSHGDSESWLYTAVIKREPLTIVSIEGESNIYFPKAHDDYFKSIKPKEPDDYAGDEPPW